MGEIIEVNPKAGIIIGAALLLTGILFTGWKYQRIAIELRSLNWKETTAEIQDSFFYVSKDSGSKSSNSFTHHGRFIYSYSVDNQEFKGTRYDGNGDMNTGIESEAISIQDKIRNHKSISIFYNPDDPSQSLIKNGISEDSWVRIMFSAFLLFTGSIVLRYQFKRFKAT